MYLNEQLSGRPAYAVTRCVHCGYLLQGLPEQALP